MFGKFSAIHMRTSTALAVLAAGILISGLAAYLVAAQTGREERLKFDSAVNDARAAINTRIQDYADVLRGVRGLFGAMNSVSRDEFRRYIQNLDLGNRYPGIQVIHYSRRISAEQRPAFEAMVRSDTSIDPRGYPEFRIRPPGDRPEYVVAQYVEPMEGNERALGLDLGGDAVRLAALERTRESGRITASGTIALALDPAKHPGFAMRLAIYRKDVPVRTTAERREAFTGVISASFVVIDLMQGVLNEQFLKDIHVQIHDAGFLNNPRGPQPPDEENLLFDSDRLRDPAAPRRLPFGDAAAATLRRVNELEVGGRRWNLYYSARRGFGDPMDRWLPWVVLATGLTISLLLYGLIRSLATTGSRAVELANRITEDLRNSEARLAAAQRMTQQLIEALPNPIYFKGRDGRYLGVNKAWEAYFGTPRSAFLGKTVHDLYPNDPQIAERLQATDQALWDRPGVPQVHETSITTPDGRQHEAIYYKATFTDAEGSVAGMIGTIVDITERKQAERSMRDSESRYRSVVAAIAEGVLLRDKDRRIVTCNASAERILGRSLDEMRGSTYFDPDWQVIREDGSDLPEDDRPVNLAQSTGKLQSNVTLGFRKPDGGVLWLSMSAQPLFDEADGTLSGIVTTIVDITERMHVEQRQSMEHRVTRLLAESETPEEVMPRIIRTICETFGFACGARTLVDEQEQLIACETWSVPSAEVMEFVAAGRQPVHPQRTGGGLLRRVWTSGEPVWITDVLQEPSFRRAPLAAKAGLRAAFAFPIRFGNEILGIMEFFGRHSRQPDEVLIKSTGSIGSQIGQFMARRQAEERVRHLAHYDDLTGLPNRSMFNQRLGHALAQARRSAKSLAILFIDLDRFKNINDTLGHEAGDHVLKEAAERLRGCLRESDTVARLGGDEFVVLVEELPNPEQVAVVAQKILGAVAAPFIVGQQEFHISASIGISTYPADSEDMQNLLKNADIAMYRAKEQGKNNYQFYSAQMNVHTLERLSLESDLRHALERDEFLLHYQPKVDIRSGRIVGLEALLRWRKPGRELIPPAKFIPLAEETGLIVPIGQWVLKTACLRNKAWQEQGLPRLRVAVNLSARQFVHENFLGDVARVLKETALDPAWLEFEITESMVMRNPEQAVTLLQGLKAMGIHLSIDDFGTGYSSLNYLKRFPLDSVKIDRSFVRDLPGDAEDAAITQAIIAMAHSLRLKVIAEGVETAEQLQFLRDNGCDEMQGFHFSKPLPEDELLNLLRRKQRARAPTGVA